MISAGRFFACSCGKKQRREVLSGDDLNADVPYYEKGYEEDDGLEGQFDRLDEDVQKIIGPRFFGSCR